MNTPPNVIEFFMMRIEAARAAGDNEYAAILFNLFVDLDRYLDRDILVLQ